LCQDMDALLNEQVGIKHYQAERERQNIVAGANFEEFADRILEDESVVSGDAGEISKWEAQPRFTIPLPFLVRSRRRACAQNPAPAVSHDGE
jgi:hypothetical protein